MPLEKCLHTKEILESNTKRTNSKNMKSYFSKSKMKGRQTMVDRRVFLIVLDSYGIGELPDAADLEMWEAIPCALLPNPQSMILR